MNIIATDAVSDDITIETTRLAEPTRFFCGQPFAYETVVIGRPPLAPMPWLTLTRGEALHAHGFMVAYARSELVKR